MKKIYLLSLLALVTILVGCGHTSSNYTHSKDTDRGPNTSQIEDNIASVKLSYPDFFNFTQLDDDKDISKYTYPVPGLIQTKTIGMKHNKTGLSHEMDPQGVTIAEDYLLISAYSHGHEYHSVIYVLDKHTHEYIKTVVLDGDPHVGGITYDTKAKNIWICSETPVGSAQISSIPLAELEAYHFNKQKKPIVYDQQINLKGIKKASYITFHNDSIYVGYFSDNHEATLETYNMTENGKFIKEMKERKILTQHEDTATPDSKKIVAHGIQGITFYKDYILLSQSYGDHPSKIFVYDNKKDHNLKQKEALKSIEAPPYMEQITAVDDQLYVIFESGTTRFRDELNIDPINYVILMDLKKITSGLTDN